MAELQRVELQWSPNKREFLRYLHVLAAAALKYSEVRDAAIASGNRNHASRAEEQLLFCAESAEASQELAADFGDITPVELESVAASVGACVMSCPGYETGYRARLAALKKGEGDSA